MTRIEEAITEWFGPRCDDFNAHCACCQAWREYDTLRDKIDALSDQLRDVRGLKP